MWSWGYKCTCNLAMGFLYGSVGKESTCNARDTRDVGSIPGSERSLGGGNSNPLQYSCLGNPMRGYSQKGLKELEMTEWLSTHTQTHTLVGFLKPGRTLGNLLTPCNMSVCACKHFSGVKTPCRSFSNASQPLTGYKPVFQGMIIWGLWTPLQILVSPEGRKEKKKFLDSGIQRG